MSQLHVIEGRCGSDGRTGCRDEVGEAIRQARSQGLVVGRRVAIRAVEGTVIGYNIAGTGLYRGHRYPLVVDTRFGILKCSAREVVLR